MRNIIILGLSTFLVFSGCENSDSVADTESILLGLLDSDEAAGVDGFDSNGDAELNHDIGLEMEGMGRVFSDTLSFGEGYRIRFGRRVLERDRTVDFETGLDTSIGLVTYTMSGIFISKAIDTSDYEQIDSLSFEKDFTTTLTRKIRFIRVDDANDPDGYSWKIDALTPLVGGAGDKVSISELRFYSLSNELQVGDLLYSFSPDNAGDLFIGRDSIPSFTAFERVVVQASINNNGPEYSLDTTGIGEWVFHNYGKSRIQRGRRHLHDSGLFFDQNVNDNIHSGALRVHGPGMNQVRGVFRTFTEVVDLSTIFVSDGGYNTNVLSIPYRVERPQ